METKSIEEFQWMPSAKNNRDWICKPCRSIIKYNDGYDNQDAANALQMSRKELYKYPELLEAKRMQLSLNKYINEKCK